MADDFLLTSFNKLLDVASILLWGSSSVSGLFRLPEWWEENLTSGQGSSEERFQVISRFSELLILDVPGTATEQVRTCGFRRNSSSFDSAPKIRDSVLLNSFQSFLVILPPISSETWEMWSWVASGSSVFCTLLFLVLSGVSMETAASFLLFRKVAMRLRVKFYQRWRLNLCFYLYNSKNLLLLWGKRFQSKMQALCYSVQNLKAAILYNKKLYFCFSYLHLSLAGNIIVYTLNQGTNREKYFNHIIYKGKGADFCGK